MKTYEEGLTLGRERGLKAGIEKGHKKGLCEGKEQGRKDGYKDGKADGFCEGVKHGTKITYPKGYREGALFISHAYVASVEKHMATADGYADLEKWRLSQKIPAWWLSTILSLWEPLGKLIGTTEEVNATNQEVSKC